MPKKSTGSASPAAGAVDNVTPIRKGEVDGQPALIDGTAPKPEPIFAKPTLEEAIDSLRSAFVDLDEAKAAHAETTEDLTKAKKAVENRARYVVELSGSADERQLTLGDTPAEVRASFAAANAPVDDFDNDDGGDDD